MSARPAADLSALDEDGRLVYESLAATPRHVDEVARFTGLSTSRIQRSLLTLVLAGLIEDRGGGTYALPR
jgi:predicted Rossmann fold nucleotide-binding protein DprA/Smf involved in DNA uptake